MDVEEGELCRLRTLRTREEALLGKGYRYLVGVDEAGRGPLAGPVVAAACHIPGDVWIAGVDDSKRLTAKRRASIYDRLVGHPRVVGAIGVATVEEVDALNIYRATLVAMCRAIEALSITPDYLLVDGNVVPTEAYPGAAVVGGDASSYLIAAASILAKEYRDRHMLFLDQKWPHYGFAKHKGYGTAAHMEALRQHGPCACHRRTFAPVRELLAS